MVQVQRIMETIHTKLANGKTTIWLPSQKKVLGISNPIIDKNN